MFFKHVRGKLEEDLVKVEARNLVLHFNEKLVREGWSLKVFAFTQITNLSDETDGNFLDASFRHLNCSFLLFTIAFHNPNGGRIYFSSQLAFPKLAIISKTLAMTQKSFFRREISSDLAFSTHKLL